MQWVSACISRQEKTADPGEEHGSARWGNVKSVVKRYMDKDSYKNIILSQNMRLGLNAKRHRRNLNVLVVGGSDAGKPGFTQNRI